MVARSERAQASHSGFCFLRKPHPARGARVPAPRQLCVSSDHQILFWTAVGLSPKLRCSHCSSSEAIIAFHERMIPRITRLVALYSLLCKVRRLAFRLPGCLTNRLANRSNQRVCFSDTLRNLQTRRKQMGKPVERSSSNSSNNETLETVIARRLSRWASHPGART